VYPNVDELVAINNHLATMGIRNCDEIHYITDINDINSTFDDLIPKTIASSSLRKLVITTEKSSMSFSDPNHYFSELFGIRNIQHIHIITYNRTVKISDSIEMYVRGISSFDVSNSDYDENNSCKKESVDLLDGFLQDLT
jgi:hypothetical protein